MNDPDNRGKATMGTIVDCEMKKTVSETENSVSEKIIPSRRIHLGELYPGPLRVTEGESEDAGVPLPDEASALSPRLCSVLERWFRDKVVPRLTRG